MTITTAPTKKIGPRQLDALAYAITDQAKAGFTANEIRDYLEYTPDVRGSQAAHGLLAKLVDNEYVSRKGTKFSGRPSGTRSQVTFKVTTQGRAAYKRAMR